MSLRSQLVLAMSAFLALSPTVAVFAAHAPDAASEARMVTFDNPTGDTCFALSLTPNVALKAEQDSDIVILFDTSASQTGLYREDGLAILESTLATLSADDRVRLLAVDLDAVPMHDGFLAPQSEAMKQAVADLKKRVPLGSTDMAAALTAASDSLTQARPRSIVYIGDGLSRANLLQTEEFRQLVDRLVEDQIAVSSYAIGPRRDIQLLAMVANHTGGQVLVDTAEQNPQRAGLTVARAARGTVVWPLESKLPASMSEVYPRKVPPLRVDRDSILVGTLSSRLEQQIEIRGMVAGKPVTLDWRVVPEMAQDDFSFLPQLLTTARQDEGLTLPTVGSAGLREVARSVRATADQLSRISVQALRTGDLTGARRVAEAAIQRDPGNQEALIIRRAVDREQQPAAPEPAPALNDESFLHDSDSYFVVFQDDAPAGDADKAAGRFRDAVDGKALNEVEAERRVREQLVEKEVENGLLDARRGLAETPETVRQTLKVLLEHVEQAPDLNADVRLKLRNRVESAIREAGRREVEVSNQRSIAEQNRIAALEAQAITEDLARNRERVRHLMERFNALMDEGNYSKAEVDIAMEIRSLDPNNPTAVAGVWNARFTRHVSELQRIRELRHANFADALLQVEMAHIPFPDEPPIVYPDAEVWEELTLRRKKYASIDLARTGGSEEKIFAALQDPTELTFDQESLANVIDYLKDYHEIPILIDTKALDDVGIGSDTPITMDLSGITLRSGLRLMLDELDLTYVIRNEVLLITTPEEAESQLITKVYPVGDLVLPIAGAGVNPFSLGGGVGGQGGFGGGLGGGGGGGFGGGGQGGGGFGGGGGGFGGGGGGIFDMEDDLKLGGNRKTETDSPLVKSPRIALDRRVTAIELTVPTNETPAQAWDRYFQEVRLKTDQDRLEHARKVRETVRQRMHQAQRLYAKGVKEDTDTKAADEKFAEVVTIIQTSLRYGYPQPWMYEAMSLALRAQDAPDSEIERALMSAVDFSENDEAIMHAANQMVAMGLDKRALSLYRELAESHPYRPEPYMAGLATAKRLNDLEGKMWASAGILRQAWPREHRAVESEAIRTAQSLLDQLRKSGQDEQADRFESTLDRALTRDCVVKVTWTGDADIDLMVEEPAGTLCSVRNARTTSGGVMLGDTFARQGGSNIRGYSETYICPQGFSGEYRVLLRRIWGNVTAGKVTVDVFTTNSRKPHIHQQIDLGKKDAMVIFSLENGRREEALEAHTVANVAQAQVAASRAILARQFERYEGSSAAESMFAANQQGRKDGRLVDPRLRRPRKVGFRPVITTLPEGTNMTATAVISADRRYVRITAIPFFSGIGDVSTFNFSSGQSTNQPAGDDDDDDDDNGGNNN